MIPKNLRYCIFLLPIIFLFSCKTLDNLINPNKTSDKQNKDSNGCASMTIGDDKKIVCGDSKDRVLEKLGQPDSVSPDHSQWKYGLCVIKFNGGSLKIYGGKYDLKQISNDSFSGLRIEFGDNKIYESKPFINTRELKKQTNCLKIENRDSFSTVLSLMGQLNYLVRNPKFTLIQKIL